MSIAYINMCIEHIVKITQLFVTISKNGGRGGNIGGGRTCHGEKIEEKISE